MSVLSHGDNVFWKTNRFRWLTACADCIRKVCSAIGHAQGVALTLKTISLEALFKSSKALINFFCNSSSSNNNKNSNNNRSSSSSSK